MGVTEEEFRFAAADGAELFARRWVPAERAKGIVQIVHGVGDHSGRYARFGRYLAQQGYAAYGLDQRGHGRTGRNGARILDGGAGTFERILGDLHTLMTRGQRDWPGVPAVLFAHSFGSLLAQRYLQIWGRDLAGAVLSGTFGSIPAVEVTICLAEALATGPFAQMRSPLFGAMYREFNRPFRPNRTRCDWLTRDAAEADVAARDPYLGRRPTNELAADLLHGLERTWLAENEARVPRELPVLLISGGEDPTTERTVASGKLFERYRRLGLTTLAHWVYPGARHELLNEINRDEVMSNVAQWMDDVIGASDSSLRSK